MKLKTLSVLAGVGVPLIMTARADADFVGLTWTTVPNAFNLHVVRVYAEFDNQGADWMEAVAGTPGSPMNITVIGGVFYNNQFGSDQAPGTLLVNAFPSLAYDSFFTIGIEALAAGSVNALNLVNMPVLAGTSVSTVNGSWGLVPPTAAQGNPFDPINSFPGDGRSLIGQFSVQIPDEGPYGITGEMLLGYVGDGECAQAYGNFSSVVPSPGALAFAGVAGLMLTRRRRRPSIRRE